MSYGRLGHNFNLGYADGSLANAGAYTVRPGIAAADDEYPFAAGVDELVFRKVSPSRIWFCCASMSRAK